MDFKKFGPVIVVLGMLIVGYGGVRLATNQPLQVEQPDNASWLDRLSLAAQVAPENFARQSRRREATMALVVGGVILFLGLGMIVSARDGSAPA